MLNSIQFEVGVELGNDTEIFIGLSHNMIFMIHWPYPGSSLLLWVTNSMILLWRCCYIFIISSGRCIQIYMCSSLNQWFWHEWSALQSVAVRRSTGNDVSGHYFHRFFFLSFFSSFFSFSPSSIFLLEGVLGSRNFFGESGSKWPIT